ncbi:MAG TPA: hypothetical protein VL171_09920 [Verrucomicrobiae bacterium]|nr:hypothetical protein [Verrucomicrobiae bacterium]
MSASRQAATLNTVGVIVLVLGIGSAILLYRHSRPAASNTNGDWQDNSLSLTDSKANTRDIEMYGGKLEVLMVKWMIWFRRPESQAIVIATLSVLLALSCFLGARHLSADT